MLRNKAYYRHHRYRVIRRKLKIVNVIWFSTWSIPNELSVRQIGKFAKGKIHCSCSSCSPKFNHHPKAKEQNKINLMKKEIQKFVKYGVDLEE